MRRPEIGNLRVLVKILADSMAHEIPHHREPLRLYPLLDRKGDVEETVSDPCLLNPHVEGSLCHLEKRLGR